MHLIGKSFAGNACDVICDDPCGTIAEACVDSPDHLFLFYYPTSGGSATIYTDFILLRQGATGTPSTVHRAYWGASVSTDFFDDGLPRDSAVNGRLWGRYSTDLLQGVRLTPRFLIRWSPTNTPLSWTLSLRFDLKIQGVLVSTKTITLDMATTPTSPPNLEVWMPEVTTPADFDSMTDADLEVTYLGSTWSGNFSGFARPAASIRIEPGGCTRAEEAP